MASASGQKLKMANMIKLLLVAFAIHFTLVITGVVTMPGTSIYTFLTNPISWETTNFLGLVSDVFLSVGVAATIIAGTIVTRSDIFLFAGIASVLLSFGLPLAELWIIIEQQSNLLFSTTSGWIVATMLVSPIILIYVITCIAWWRGQA